MQFSSRPPFNDDPWPWVTLTGTRGGYSERYAHIITHAPRPQYERPQHNPTNQILWSFFPPGYRVGRRVRPFVLAALREIRLGHWDGRVDVEMIDHARRVLTRLANLTKEED